MILRHDILCEDRRAAYRQLLRSAISQHDLRQTHESSHKRWTLGSDRFKRQVEVLSQRRAASKGRQAEKE